MPAQLPLKADTATLVRRAGSLLCTAAVYCPRGLSLSCRLVAQPFGGQFHLDRRIDIFARHVVLKQPWLWFRDDEFHFLGPVVLGLVLGLGGLVVGIAAEAAPPLVTAVCLRSVIGGYSESHSRFQEPPGR